MSNSDEFHHPDPLRVRTLVSAALGAAAGVVCGLARSPVAVVVICACAAAVAVLALAPIRRGRHALAGGSRLASASGMQAVSQAVRLLPPHRPPPPPLHLEQVVPLVEVYQPERVGLVPSAGWDHVTGPSIPAQLLITPVPGLYPPTAACASCGGAATPADGCCNRCGARLVSPTPPLLSPTPSDPRKAT